ncbi:AAA family ATPase [Alteromonas sp. a30]|uniref:AAA family ATPase n=1 Tax=Alteromonas sp. a30 TaxID=2730917 RepID=UPI0022812D3F|nr:ATP-binding protein [Alteromonas sp. a30]MCY7294608.1 ATP-binding protein [Alteromonas sp. a30]
MLIEFIVKNFRSIKEEQIFSMVKASKIKDDELEASNTFKTNDQNNTELLASAVIYGANASGKSNFVNALRCMNTIVKHSSTSLQEGDSLPVEPFLFDESTSEAPSEFEAVFIYDDIKYQYGFSATQARVHDEWLIAFPKQRPQKWFSRVFDEETQEYDYKFSDNLLGNKQIWHNATRDNALFLSTAVQLNSEQLKPVFNWFRHVLQPVINFDNWGPRYTGPFCLDDGFKRRVIDLLQAADLNIHDLAIESKKFDSSLLPDELPQEIKEKIHQEMKDEEILDIRTVHKTQSGKLVTLDLEEESDGTQKLFSIAGPLLDVLEKGYILVIDELHNSFHPKMVEGIIRLFHNKEVNKHNAQLIFSTHETSVLNQHVFRRDQIWFCEKEKFGETSIYPLTDFSPRKADRENLEAGYLSGKYGAVPFITSLGG